MAIARKYGDYVYFWNVPDIQNAARNLPTRQVTVDSFDFDIDVWFGEACEPTIKNVVHHMKYILIADVSNPIILSSEGHVFDGLHRLAKCIHEGIPSISARQFQENPIPFKIEQFEKFQVEKPLIASSLVRMESGKL